MARSFASSMWRFLCAILALATGGCSGSSPVTARPPREATNAARGGLAAPESRTVHSGERFALVSPGTFGPHLGTRAGKTIAVWATEQDRKRGWYTINLGPRGAPLGSSRRVADAAPEVNLVAVRPAGGTGGGFLLLSTSREFSGERIDVIGLGEHGELLGGPSLLAQGLPDVVWIDVVPTRRGAIALWATRREDRADLSAVELGEAGEPQDPPVVLLRDVRAWQVAAVPDGVAIAAAMAGQGGEHGPLLLCFTDAEGHIDRKLVLADGATVEPDVDLARMGDRLVVAWSDTARVDARITAAAVDLGGNVVKNDVPLVPPFGPQALVRLVGPRTEGAPGFVAWENVVERPRGGRAIRVSSLSRDLVLGPTTWMVTGSGEGAMPELTPSDRGLAALTVAPQCELGGDCSRAPSVPTFVEIDPGAGRVTSEPIRLTSLRGRAVDLAWGLSCGDGDCLALAAAPSNPAPIYAVSLGGRTSGRFEPAVTRSQDGPLPRVDRLDIVGKSESLAGVARARLGSGQLVSWVTSLDPAAPFVRSKKAAPDGKYEEPRALLSSRYLPFQGTPGGPTVLSYRVHSPGGVAMAPGDPSRDEALVVWTGVDDRKPQVFLTLLGAQGRKVAQKMLTHGRRGVRDVAVANVADGWVVAWVEEQVGSSEIHVAKVDRQLAPVVRERRLLPGGSVQTGVQLLAQGEHVLAVWSDTRDGSRAAEGGSSIYALRLSSRDLAAVAPEHVVGSSRQARSPAVAAFGEGALVGWVEEPPPGSTGVSGTLRLARLDSGAELLGVPTPLLVSGSPLSLGIGCEQTECHAAAVVSTARGAAIEVLPWTPRGPGRPVRLLSLGGAPRERVSPLVLGDELLYADERRPGDVRLRRAHVVWR